MQKRVLVIEDDELLSGAIQAGLEPDFEVLICAETPSIEATLEFSPDVIMIDCMLPGGRSSTEYLREVRGHPSLRAVRVIVTSGHHDVLRTKPGLQSLSDAFLPKPFTLDELSETVTKLASA